MVAREFLREVEQNMDVGSVTCRGKQVWPFLRQVYFFQYHRHSLGLRPPKKVRWFHEQRRVPNLFYGMGDWLRRYDWLLFCSSKGRALVRENHAERASDWVMAALGRDRGLTVEFSEAGRHYSRRVMPDQHIVSCDPLNLLLVLPALNAGHVEIHNENVLRQINAEYRLAVNYRWAILSTFRLVRVFRCLLRVWQPKVVFMTCYYCMMNQAVILAAKQLGIKTVELQHGHIKNDHFAYKVPLELDRSSFPDYLMCYGDYVKKLFGPHNNFIAEDRVFAVGNGYVEYMADLDKPDPLLLAQIQRYRVSVAVTTQWSLEDELIKFVRDAAIRNQDILYVIVPRVVSKDYSRFAFPLNVTVLPHLRFYDIARHTDFHATVCSTCALEAPAMGTPNVLIDLKGWARDYYGDVLTDERVTRIVSTPEEFVQAVSTWDTEDRRTIRSFHREFYKPGHQSLVYEVLKDRLKLDVV